MPGWRMPPMSPRCCRACYSLYSPCLAGACRPCPPAAAEPAVAGRGEDHPAAAASVAAAAVASASVAASVGVVAVAVAAVVAAAAVAWLCKKKKL